MDQGQGAPPWFDQSRYPLAVPPWRGMYPPLAQHHYRNSYFGYYQQHPMQTGHVAWQDQWANYYPQLPVNTRHEERRRPASRAEIYERVDQREPYRPLSRLAYDERHGFYEAEYREYYGNRDYRYTPTALEKDWRREAYSQHMKQWVQNPPHDYYLDQNIVKEQPHSEAPHRKRGYEDSNAWQSDGRCNSSEMDRFTQSRSSTEPSLLSQYRDSGMSSSSYELSQYMHDPADLVDSWNPVQDETLKCTPQPTAPMKFSLPHVTVCFGARGQLVRVCPNFPDEGQPALVEIHSMEVLLHETAEQEMMRNFPGPVQREDLHKIDVMSYCQQNASQCLRSGNPRSCDSALLWQVLLQMCRQNGCIAGTDLAELLLQDCKRENYKNFQLDSDLMSLSDDLPLIPDGAQVDLLTGETPSAAETSARAVEKFTKLLFFGRKKEALDWAIKSQLWGHALFLSSKMDSRTYSWVMARFTSTLARNDPLQTLFQLMAGRLPQAATCTGDSKWGNWRPHLAIMLSNQMSDPGVNQRSIITMGDHLVQKGYTEAGHCCYLTAGISLGQLCEKSDRMVLFGSNQTQPFKKFVSTENIQRTEILEYCQSLGKSNHCVPSFQVYKFLYATRLLDYGLTSLALHYCECIASALLSSASGSSVLISELIKFAEHLRYSDPQILQLPDPEQKQEPLWLAQLRALHQQIQGKQVETSYCPGPESAFCLSKASAGVSRICPITYQDQKHPNQIAHQINATDVSDVPKLSDNTEVYPDDRMVSVIQNTVEHHVESWVPQYPNQQPIDAQSENHNEWDQQETETNTDISNSYNVYTEPQVQGWCKQSSNMAFYPFSQADAVDQCFGLRGLD
ncbi:protein transport protein Sec16B [Gastrophryne carolinensis]